VKFRNLSFLEHQVEEYSKQEQEKLEVISCYIFACIYKHYAQKIAIQHTQNIYSKYFVFKKSYKTL